MKRIRLSAAAMAVAGISALLAATGFAYSTFGSWNNVPVTYYVNPQSLWVTADAAEAAVGYAANVWTTSGAKFAYSYGGRTSISTVGNDGQNVVMFRNATNNGALATTYWWTSGSRILDADTVFWEGSYQFYTGTTACTGGGAYIEDVATHELGHALGMLHSTVTTATMYPSYYYCSEDMRTLDPDDVAGIESLYGTGTQSATTNSAPTVTITSPGGSSSFTQGTPITFSGSATDTKDGDISASLVWKSNLQGQIGTGPSFTATLVAGTHTVTASVTDSSGVTGSANISVTVTVPCGSANPAVTLSPSNVSIGAGWTQSYTVTITNNDNTTCSAATFTPAAGIPGGWTAAWSSTAVAVNPGSTASVMLKVTSPAGTPAGSYGIPVTATNSANATYTGSASILENIISSLTVSVATDLSTYSSGQKVNIAATVMQSSAPSPSTKVTITINRPDGTVYKTFTPTTGSNGVATVSVKAPMPLGTYTVTATAAKSGLSGTASTTFLRQ